MAKRPQLLYGPYHPPDLFRGFRTTCLYRSEAIITGWSIARIQWPRCRAIGTQGGGAGLLIDKELARAIRHESAEAIKYWWGVSTKTVWQWRRALGVDRMNNPTTHALYIENAHRGGEASRKRGVTEAERRERRRRSKELNLIRHAHAKSGKRPWTADELAQLGKLPDCAVAAQVDRTVEAVRNMRTRRGIPRPTARHRRS